MSNAGLVGIIEQLLGYKTTKTINITETKLVVKDSFAEFRSSIASKNYRSFIYEGTKFYFIYNKVIIEKKAFIQGRIFNNGKAFTNNLSFDIPLKKDVNIDFIVTKGYFHILVGANIKTLLCPHNYQKNRGLSFLNGKKVYEQKLKGCTKFLTANLEKIVLQKKNSVTIITSKHFSNSLDYILN